MRIHRILLFVIMTVWATQQISAFNEGDARRIAEAFYRDLKIVAESQGAYTDAIANAIFHAQNLCFDEEVSFPNEFSLFGIDKKENFLRSNTYMSRLMELAEMFTTKLQLTATVNRVEACEEIKSTKRENSRNFYYVYVEKTIQVLGKNIQTFEDLVCINAETSKITMIANETGGGQGESVIVLRSKAARLFEQKKFDEAFDTYLRVVALDPKQGDAYYRLGLMAYHKLGCKNRYSKGSIRREKALEYIEKAIQHGNYDIRGYASNVKYYMINGGA